MMSQKERNFFFCNKCGPGLARWISKISIPPQFMHQVCEKEEDPSWSTTKIVVAMGLAFSAGILYNQFNVSKALAPMISSKQQSDRIMEKSKDIKKPEIASAKDQNTSRPRHQVKPLAEVPWDPVQPVQAAIEVTQPSPAAAAPTAVSQEPREMEEGNLLRSRAGQRAVLPQPTATPAAIEGPADLEARPSPSASATEVRGATSTGAKVLRWAIALVIVAVQVVAVYRTISNHTQRLETPIEEAIYYDRSKIAMLTGLLTTLSAIVFAKGVRVTVLTWVLRLAFAVLPALCLCAFPNYYGLAVYLVAVLSFMYFAARQSTYSWRSQFFFFLSLIPILFIADLIDLYYSFTQGGFIELFEYFSFFNYRIALFPSSDEVFLYHSLTCCCIFASAML